MSDSNLVDSTKLMDVMFTVSGGVYGMVKDKINNLYTSGVLQEKLPKGAIVTGLAFVVANDAIKLTFAISSGDLREVAKVAGVIGVRFQLTPPDATTMAVSVDEPCHALKNIAMRSIRTKPRGQFSLKSHTANACTCHRGPHQPRLQGRGRRGRICGVSAQRQNTRFILEAIRPAVGVSCHCWSN